MMISEIKRMRSARSTGYKEMQRIHYPNEIEIAACNFEGMVTDRNRVLVFAYTGVVGGEAVEERCPQTRIVLLVVLQPIALVRRAAVQRGTGTTHGPLLTAALLQSHWRCISLYRIFD